MWPGGSFRNFPRSSSKASIRRCGYSARAGARLQGWSLQILAFGVAGETYRDRLRDLFVNAQKVAFVIAVIENLHPAEGSLETHLAVYLLPEGWVNRHGENARSGEGMGNLGLQSFDDFLPDEKFLDQGLLVVIGISRSVEIPVGRFPGFDLG